MIWLVVAYIVMALISVRLLTNFYSPFEDDVFILIGAIVWPITWVMHGLLLALYFSGPAFEYAWEKLKGKP